MWEAAAGDADGAEVGEGGRAEGRKRKQDHVILF